MFVIISNQSHATVYGPFSSATEATTWARHHLVGFCWNVTKLAAIAA